MAHVAEPEDSRGGSFLYSHGGVRARPGDRARTGPPRGGTRRSTADFAPTGLVRPNTTSPLSLIASDAVEEELGLTPEQKQKLEELRKVTLEKQRALLAELQKRAAAANQEAETALHKLLDEKQNARIGQLQLQREGITALARPEVAAKLGLNDEQREKIDEAGRG